MEKVKDKIEKIVDDFFDYADTRQELVKLQMVEKTTRIVSNAFSYLIIIPFFVFALVFISITLADVFADLWGSRYGGYLTVTGIYLVAGLLMFRYRKPWLQTPMMNGIIKQVLSKKENVNHQ